MPNRKPPPSNQRPQSEDFIETARKLGADESREEFEKVFQKITEAKPLRSRVEKDTK
jgi:hypothetical protein